MTRADDNRNLVAAISYFPFISILVAAAIFFVERDDKFIRFHALQAILISVFYFLISIILGQIPFGASLSGLVFLAFLAIWLISAYLAWRGQIFKWPIVGGFAERKVG